MEIVILLKRLQPVQRKEPEVDVADLAECAHKLHGRQSQYVLYVHEMMDCEQGKWQIYCHNR